MDYINEPKITIDDIDDQIITDLTTYNARTQKFRAIIYGTGDVRFGGLVNTTEHYEVDGKQVVGNQVVDARIDDTINTSAWDSTTAGVLDSLRDAMITHGLIAAS